jgi:hypothetical protein
MYSAWCLHWRHDVGEQASLTTPAREGVVSASELEGVGIGAGLGVLRNFLVEHVGEFSVFSQDHHHVGDPPLFHFAPNLLYEVLFPCGIMGRFVVLLDQRAKAHRAVRRVPFGIYLAVRAVFHSGVFWWFDLGEQTGADNGFAVAWPGVFGEVWIRGAKVQ